MKIILSSQGIGVDIQKLKVQVEDDYLLSLGEEIRITYTRPSQLCQPLNLEGCLYFVHIGKLHCNTCLFGVRVELQTLSYTTQM